MTKLNDWMGEALDDNWLAGVLGVSRSQASRVRRGKCRPSPAGALNVEKATKGKIKAIDLLASPLPANDPASQQAQAA